MTDSLPPEGKHPDVIDAEAPPAKPGKYVSDAKVPWARITELRAALTACGIPWEPGT